jgi:phospholipid/cholesterol/gamma-HCH transport system substrate-binding protein
MTTLLTRVQLTVFIVVTLLAVGYGAVSFFNVGAIVRPAFEVRAQFETSGGIYPRADVELLGTRVGSVRAIVPGPGAGTTVVLAIDHGVEIPKDVTAKIGSKSAIGEQYVELQPRTAGGPVLAEGDLIPIGQTTSPLDTATLLDDLGALAGSIPAEDLSTVLTELSTGLEGIGDPLGGIIDDADQLTRVSLAGVDDLTALIDDASTVLSTQVEKGPETLSSLADLAGLTSELRRLTGDFDDLFANGVRAGVQVSNLLADNQAALPVLLNQLVAVTDVAADRLPAIRKTLVLFPYALEIGATGIRRCGSYDARTGKPVEATCRYDEQGRPIYSTYLAFQLPLAPTAPYFPCTKGYEGTVKYLPNGVPLKGGPRQERDSPVNMEAGCTASPDDPSTPLVRGAQNVPGPGVPGRTAPGQGLALFDPNSGTVVSRDGSYRVSGSDEPTPPTGTAGLAWLLNNPMERAQR